MMAGKAGKEAFQPRGAACQSLGGRRIIESFRKLQVIQKRKDRKVERAEVRVAGRGQPRGPLGSC